MLALSAAFSRSSRLAGRSGFRAVSLRGGSDGLRALSERLRRADGGPPRFLVAKPGLDGHSNGAEQIAVRARDVGMDVVYEGIRLTPAEIGKRNMSSV